jgi:hypothetical protein
MRAQGYGNVIGGVVDLGVKAATMGMGGLPVKP